jgi:5-carboxymethyl-2-hydroxymuconate isomerase
MPHLVVLYTGQLDRKVDMNLLCQKLADAMSTVTDEQGKKVFPVGGTRVLAYPAPYYAVADGGAAGLANGGDGDYGFVYLNLRMARGRSDSTKQLAGDRLFEVAKSFFESLANHSHIGVTFQIDEGHEVFDAKHSSLHPLFSKG